MTQRCAQVAMLGIPFDANSCYVKGPEKGPKNLREIFASGSLNSSTELGQDLRDNPRWSDAGDVIFTDGEDYRGPIEQRVGQLLSEGAGVLSIGGDHSVTYPILRAYARRFPTLNVLHIDAHPDLYHEHKGNPHSNACPFARVMEEHLCRRLVQVGIRTMNAHQQAQAERFAVEVVQMRDFRPDWRPHFFDGPVYLSLDMDGIDPAFAPGVSHREPGGLTSREVIQLIHNIDHPLVGADIVEFNPDRDIDHLTANLLAKLVKETAGKMLQDCLPYQV